MHAIIPHVARAAARIYCHHCRRAVGDGFQMLVALRQLREGGSVGAARQRRQLREGGSEAAMTAAGGAERCYYGIR